MRINPLRKAGTIGAMALGATFYWQWLNAAPTVVVPTPVLPSPNAHDLLYAAGKQITDDTKIGEAHVLYPPDNQHHYTLAEKEALIAENAPALDGLRAALSTPFWNPPARSITTLFPEFAKYRGLARLLLLESQVRSAHGDNAGAVNSCLDAVEIGIKVPRGGVIIAALVGNACESIGDKPMWGLVDTLNADEAAVAAKRLEALTDQRVPFADALKEEKWYGQAMLTEAFHDKSTFQAWNELHKLAMGEENSENADQFTTAKDTLFAYRSLLTHSKRAILADYTTTMDASMARAGKPIQFANDEIPVGTDAFNQVLSPVWTQARHKDARTQMESGLLLCSLALRAYRLHHGEYPAALADLVSDGILQRVPGDPWAQSAGTSFGYRREDGDKYTLYSVGADGIDDGGAPVDLATIKPTGRTWPQLGDRGDWVVGVNIGGPAVTVPQK